MGKKNPPRRRPSNLVGGADALFRIGERVGLRFSALSYTRETPNPLGSS